MDFRQLQALIAIADHGSFSAAATALHTVQSNVSSHVARLERELMRYEYQYPGRSRILLIFYRVLDFDGSPQNLDFEQIRWVCRLDVKPGL